MGQCKLGAPASLWQLPAARDLGDQGYFRGALFQCHVAPVGYPKPVGFHTHLSGMRENLYMGWPTFGKGMNKRRGNRKGGNGTYSHLMYTGPLPHSCGHSSHRGLARQAGDADFRTGPAAAYPPELCYLLAKALLFDFVERHPRDALKDGDRAEGLGGGVARWFPGNRWASGWGRRAADAEGALPTGTGPTGAGPRLRRRGLHRQGLPRQCTLPLAEPRPGVCGGPPGGAEVLREVPQVLRVV